MAYSTTAGSTLLGAVLLVSTLVIVGCAPDTPQSRAAVGKELLQKKDYKAAVVQFKSALQLDPESAEGRFLLGQALLKAGDPIGAVVELTRALKLEYPPDKVLPELARALLVNSEEKKLTDLYGETTLEDKPAMAALKSSVATAWLGQRNPAKADAAIAAALSAVPEYGPALTLTARRLAEQGRFDEALGQVDKVLARDPTLHEAWALKGEIVLAAQQDTKSAEEAFGKALSVDPTYLPAHLSLIAMKLRVQSDLPGARAQADRLRSVLPKHPQMMFVDAMLAYASKDFGKSRELVQVLMRVASDDPGLLQLAGAVESQLGALSIAENFFNRALAIDPQLPLARKNLASIYLRQAQPNRALDALKPLLGADVADADAHRLAGDAYLRMSNAPAAEAAFNAAAKIRPGDSRTAATQALLKLERGDVAKALSDLTALSSNGTDTVPDKALLSAHLSRGDLDAALTAANNMVKKAPDDASAFEALGGLQIRRKDLGAARAAYIQAARLEPTLLSATIALATIDVLEKKPDEAQKRLEESINSNPRSPYPRQALAELRLRAGAPATEVAALLDEAIKLLPGDADLRLQRIELALQKRQFKDALSAAQDAASALPNDSRVLEALGRAQMSAGGQEQAINTFRRLIGLDPKSIVPYSRLADIYEAAGKNKEAEVILKKAVEVQPGSGPMQNALVKLLTKQGKQQEALAFILQIQRDRPTDNQGYLQEAQFHVSNKASDSAVAALRKGLARNPSSPQLGVALYSLLRGLGRAEETDRFGEAWQKKHPNDAVFGFQVATTKVLRGDLDSAEVLLTGILARFPSDPLTLNNLAWVQTLRNKPEAVINAQRAVNAMPREAAMVDTLAHALAANNRLKEALETQKRAVEISPADNELRLNLARIAAQAGDKALARIELERLQALGARFAPQNQVKELLRSL